MSPSPHRQELDVAAEVARLRRRMADDVDDRHLMEHVRDTLALCEAADSQQAPSSTTTTSGEWLVATELDLDAAPPSEEVHVIDISAVAFAARLELRPLLDKLDHGSEEDDDRERARRKATRVLRALEMAAGSEESVEDDEVHAALQIRRRYTQLRRAIAILSRGELTDSHLACARAQLQVLLTSEVAPQLRALDRHELVALDVRVRDLSEHAHSASERERLWQDLSGFVSLLAEVRRRAELVEHDTSILAAAWPDVQQPTVLVPRLRAALDDLFGLDDAVDELLERRRWDPSEWRVALAPLHARMVRPVTGTFLRPAGQW